jgi:hypothetical protein
MVGEACLGLERHLRLHSRDRQHHPLRYLTPAECAGRARGGRLGGGACGCPWAPCGPTLFVR